MKEHLLIEKAYIYPVPRQQLKVEGCKYDRKNGYWIQEETGEPMVFDRRHPGPQTKKCDIETGEDQKGE